MIISFTLLQNSMEKYKKNRESYNKWEFAQAGLGMGLATGFVFISVVFFILELVVLIYALNIAVKCTQGGSERVVHVVLAVAFTFPYMLISLFFNKCASGVLKGENPLVIKEQQDVPVNMAFMANKIN